MYKQVCDKNVHLQLIYVPADYVFVDHPPLKQSGTECMATEIHNKLLLHLQSSQKSMKSTPDVVTVWQGSISKTVIVSRITEGPQRTYILK